MHKMQGEALCSTLVNVFICGRQAVLTVAKEFVCEVILHCYYGYTRVLARGNEIERVSPMLTGEWYMVCCEQKQKLTVIGLFPADFHI